GDVEPYTHGALVQVGLAVGGSGGETDHRHHRIAAEHDYPDVGHPLVGIAGEPLVEANQRLDQGDIRRTAEGIEPGENVGDVTLDVRKLHPVAARLDVDALGAALDHQDALAAAAFGRLAREALMSVEHLADIPDAELRGDGTD